MPTDPRRALALYEAAIWIRHYATRQKSGSGARIAAEQIHHHIHQLAARAEFGDLYDSAVQANGSTLAGHLAPAPEEST